MTNQVNLTEFPDLIEQLREKRQLFDKLLSENKEFEEVKALFDQIRGLERMLMERHPGSPS